MNAFLVSLLALMFCLTPTPLANAGQSRSSDDQTLTIVRGRVACLDQAGKRVDELFGCNGPSPRFALTDKTGKTYNFLATDIQAAIFTDSRVRQRELQVTARLRSTDQLEIIKVQSIREGKLYDLYYYCEVCNIRAYVPGPCPCCHNELEFREVPAEDSNH